jgi:lactate dehydrogenase-like 2-hydroxyacid dehydrogenase
MALQKPPTAIKGSRRMPARPKILVTRKLPGPVEARLARDFDALLNAEDKPMTPAEIHKALEGRAGLLLTPGEKCTAEFINALPATVRIMATFSVGHDHIDLGAAKAKALIVTNTPDVLTDATADIAMLLILGAARGASWGERMVREGRWTSWSPIAPLGFDVTGKKLGIVGMGRIGQALAKRARGFDMEIHYFNRRRLPTERELGAHYHSVLSGMLPHCDFLSINCASTPETRGMINADVFAKLPEGAILINSARGDIINDDDLIDALKSGRLAAAGLDVFRNEPNIDKRFLEIDNVFLLPHLGSATHDTRAAMGMRAVDNLEQFFKGQSPRDRLA